MIAEEDDCDLRRDRIVYFATHAFLSRGCSGSSLEEIAVAAGVSKLTIYRAFGNKADLLREVIIRAMTRMIDSVTTPLDPTAPVEDTLTAYCPPHPPSETDIEVDARRRVRFFLLGCGGLAVPLTMSVVRERVTDEQSIHVIAR